MWHLFSIDPCKILCTIYLFLVEKCLVAAVKVPQAETGRGTSLRLRRVFINSAITYPPMRTHLITIESIKYSHMSWDFRVVLSHVPLTEMTVKTAESAFRLRHSFGPATKGCHRLYLQA